MSAAGSQVISVFSDAATFVEALKRLKQAGQRELSVFSPVGLAELEHLLPRRDSPIRFIVLVAGALGLAGGFWMCIGSALLYDLVVGGKLPAAWLPYCIVGFEATVLAAGLTAIAAVVALGGLARWRPRVGYHPGFSQDRFGITVRCGEREAGEVASLLREAGAEEVREHTDSGGE
jgi:hypothetical protein